MTLVGWSDAAYGGPVDERKVPIGTRDRVDVVDFEEPAPYSAMGIRMLPEDGGEQPEWRSTRNQRAIPMGP